MPPTGRYGKFRPKALLADRASDSRRNRKALRERATTPHNNHFVKPGSTGVVRWWAKNDLLNRVW